MFIEKDKHVTEKIEEYLKSEAIGYEKSKVNDELFHLKIVTATKEQIKAVKEIADKYTPKIKLKVKVQAADKEVLTPGKAMVRYLAPEGEPTEEKEVEI